MLDNSCDVLVIGSGAAGLTAAITARKAGLDVIVAEKETYYGGTTAQSGGFIWIPCNHQAEALGIADTPELARQYIAHEAGGYFDAPRVEAFLANGREMLRFLERETRVQFRVAAIRPDYHPDAPGALSGGRSLAPVEFDGRELGAQFRFLRPPLPQLTFLGMFLGSAGEAEHYFNVTRSWRSLSFVARQLLRHSLEMARHGRAARLTRGGALAARLAKSAFDLDVPIWVGAPVRSLVRDGERVVGAQLGSPPRQVIAGRGVILACGGFPADSARRRAVYPHLLETIGDATVAPPGNTGDGIRMAQEMGGCFSTSVSDPAAWMPVSMIPGRHGQEAVFPHLIDRNKPGVIAVNAQARRFVNEAASYHDFVQAMFKSSRSGDEWKAFLVCDQRAIDLYGLGFAKPFPVPRVHHLRSGYLVRERTIRDLARRIGVPLEALVQTVESFNANAARGIDPEFHRGNNAYDRYQGDSRQKPNPSLRPIIKPPYYAIRLLPADIATFAGLQTDRFARVLDERSRPIPGLYAAGNDALSIMGGSYPAAGMNLGPAMTFGYIAARHVAQRRPGSAQLRMRASFSMTYNPEESPWRQ